MPKFYLSSTVQHEPKNSGSLEEIQSGPNTYGLPHLTWPITILIPHLKSSGTKRIGFASPALHIALEFFWTCDHIVIFTHYQDVFTAFFFLVLLFNKSILLTYTMQRHFFFLWPPMFEHPLDWIVVCIPRTFGDLYLSSGSLPLSLVDSLPLACGSTVSGKSSPCLTLGGGRTILGDLISTLVLLFAFGSRLSSHASSLAHSMDYQQTMLGLIIKLNVIHFKDFISLHLCICIISWVQFVIFICTYAHY